RLLRGRARGSDKHTARAVAETCDGLVKGRRRSRTARVGARLRSTTAPPPRHYRIPARSAIGSILGEMRAQSGRARPSTTLNRDAARSIYRRHRAAVLRVCVLAGAGHRRALLAVADRRQARGRDAERHQHILRRLGAALAERQIVFPRAALVAMTLDRHADIRVAAQPLGLALQDLLRLA